MHELSIAMNILEIVEENAKNLNAVTVHEIVVDIGELSGVDYDALSFALEHIERSKLVESSEIIINRIPAKARCSNCSLEFDIDDYYAACPGCSGFVHDIFQGRDLKVRTITID